MTAFFVAVGVIALLGAVWWTLKGDREQKIRWAQAVWR